ncbi:complex I NDUFA9 subunit family protein [Parvularcula sp. LCG005]|uniref:complex I NDUFA9 subunit family protein n=1 Tax=Parvularcula sp. LCG005 TaxID=3078805 RepID=UPI00294340A8|nr:complex I NDUFA9 subunit family protein [Parvularcula sp. LCG005]WOI53553.1 complex I NDUFA9 subunit family protein [Parvularcula sp. LCG005]
MADKLAVVFGASGFLGRHVVRELAAKGWRVRAAVRRPNYANHLRPLGAVGQIELSQANVRYRDTVDQALDGADAVINLVGILKPEGKQKFAAVQRDGARNIAELCAKRGITNVVHVSAIGADDDSESDYARTKAEGEAAFRQFVPETVVLRPSIIFGPQDDFFNRFAGMSRMSPFLPLIGGGKTKFQPVYVDDVADCIRLAVESADYAGRTFELGGPEVKTFKELMELTLRIVGRRRALLPIPFFAAEPMGSVGSFVDSVSPFDAPITADQVKLLKSDNVVGQSGEDNVGNIADFGITPETMETILPTYLVRFRKAGQFSPETL